MSTVNTRSNATDNYTILSNYDSSANLEPAIVQSLVQSAYDKTIITPPGPYRSPVNDSSWNVNTVDPSYIEQSALSNYPNGTVTEYSVISTRLNQSDVSVNSYTTNISSLECSNNTYTFEDLTSSAPYYDCNYVVTQSLLADCSDNVDGSFVQATFDLDASNAKIQYAMQSRWNTVTGPYNNGLADVGADPTAMSEDVSYNTEQAFAMQGSGATDASYESYWASVDPSDGSIVFNIVDTSNQPVDPNNLLLKDRDMTGVTLNYNDDVGIFRIQQPSNIITTQVSLDNASFVNISNNDLINMPLMDGYGQDPSGILTYDSSKNDLPVPGIMTSFQFQTLLNLDVYNTVADDWTFQIDMSSNDGGYDISGSHPLMTDLDDSNLLDNPYYMENYVDKDHSITYSNSTVSIDLSTNGQSFTSNLINVDLSAGETLDASYAGVNGQIIVYTKTIASRLTDYSNVDIPANINSLVMYENDDAVANLSTEEMENYYFKGMWQKIAQESDTTSADYYLNKSNKGLLTLYAGSQGIVDNSYNEADFSFNFTNTSFGSSEDIRLWKIVIFNNVIVNPQSFFEDPSYNVKVFGINTAGIITNLTEEINYNGYRIQLTPKTKEQIGLYTAVNDASGWSIDYDVSSNTFLHSSSDQAYSEGIGVPVYSQQIISDINNGTAISYTYLYKTIEEATTQGGLVDSVDIIYDYNSASVTTTIAQPDITRDYDESYTDLSYVVVPDASYSFSSPLNKDNYELVYATRNSKYNASFYAKYGPFTNVKLSIADILQENIYYAVRNKETETFLPPISLNYVNAPTIPDLTTINETIDASGGNSLSIQGTFTSEDLKPFYSVPQGEISNDTWVDIGNSIDTDVYYGLNNTDTLDGSASLITNIQFTGMGFDGNTIVEVTNVDLENDNYYIPLTFDLSGNNFALESFSSDASNIASNTDIESVSFVDNVSYLTLTNGYANAKNWVTNEYTMDYSYDSSANALITVSETLSSNVIFTIKLLNNTIFLGDFIVTYIPQDYYRVERLLGASDVSNVYSENFIVTEYNDLTVPVVHLGPVLEGVLISNNANPLSSTLDSSSIELGAYSSFRVQGDYATINEVGLTTIPDASNELGLPSYNSGSLEFQYVDASNYSAIFTFERYRGYYSYGNTPTLQYYDIGRDATSVFFNVDGSGALSDISDNLTTNMYFQESFVVNNLQNSSAELVANLNLTGSFNYSIPPTDSVLTYDVNVTGDNVVVSINNPNYLGDASNIVVDPSSTPVVDPKLYSDSTTLKEYGRDDSYTFSGLWYETGRLMGIRPSRVKLNNTAYPYDSLSYKITMEAQVIPVYKAISQTTPYYNWLGDPTTHGSQDPDVDPSNVLWELHDTYAASAIYLVNGGIDIGRKTIYQNPNLAIGYKLVYIVSTPPYYKFEQISTENCPEIPYDYSSNYLDNRTDRYMPFIDTSGDLLNVFNPFATSTDYTDISANTTTIVSDASYLNDVTFTLLQSPATITSAAESPDSTRYGILVPGTNIAVSLYLGLYNSTTGGAGHTNPIWNAPVTSIPDTPDISNNALLFRSRDASGAIFFSALQYPQDIGYPAGETGYEEILHTDISSNWYNIDLEMGNPSWFNNNVPVTYFDFDAAGIRPTLYTVVDVNNYNTQRNFRRVYKYESNASIDIDTSGTIISGFQTFNITFNSRSYRDFDISMNNTFPTSGMWKYNDLLNNTVIPNTSITWTPDSSFNDPAYISWAFGNSTTSTNMLVELLGVQDTQNKWVYLHMEPFMRYLNQFNLQVGGVSWDGSLTAPLVTTRVISLAPELNSAILQNDTYTTQQYSESTLLDYDNGTA